MNIIIFQQAPDIGGSEIYMANLIKEWVKTGDNVIIYTNNEEYKQLCKNNKAHVNHLPFILDIMGNKRGLIKTIVLLPLAIPWYLKNIFINRKKADVIVMSGYSEKLLVTALSVPFKIPVIWFEYPPMEPLLKRNLGIPRIFYKLLSKVCKRIIAISDNTAKSLILETGIPEKKVKLIYPAIPLPGSVARLTAKLKANKLRRKLGIRDKFVIGNISRLAKEKGQDYLIKSLPLIKQSVPNVCLVLAGRGPDFKRLQALCNEYQLQDDVHFLGFVSDKNAVISLFDVFVFTSLWELEGFGLVILEAMALKKPLVAFRKPPTTEILENNKNALLTKLGNSSEMAKTIIKLLKDTDLGLKLSSNAFKDVTKRFNIKDNASILRNEFTSFINQNGNEKK